MRVILLCNTIVKYNFAILLSKQYDLYCVQMLHILHNIIHNMGTTWFSDGEREMHTNLKQSLRTGSVEDMRGNNWE